MPESGEREVSNEEVLFRDDIKENFRTHADIIGIGHLAVDDRSYMVEVLSGWVDIPDTLLPILTIQRFMGRTGEVILIRVTEGPLEARESLFMGLTPTEATLVADPPFAIQPEEFAQLRGVMRDARWDPTLSRASAERIGEFPDLKIE
jgi:hypothetical protein